MHLIASEAKAFVFRFLRQRHNRAPVETLHAFANLLSCGNGTPPLCEEDSARKGPCGRYRDARMRRGQDANSNPATHSDFNPAMRQLQQM